MVTGQEVEDSNPNGGEGSFYIVVGGKKVAVAHDGNGWKVDNTALFIVENASASITGPTSGIGTFTQMWLIGIILSMTEQMVHNK